MQIQIYFRPSYPRIFMVLVARKFTAPFLDTECHRWLQAWPFFFDLRPILRTQLPTCNLNVIRAIAIV